MNGHSRADSDGEAASLAIDTRNIQFDFHPSATRYAVVRTGLVTGAVLMLVFPGVLSVIVLAMGYPIVQGLLGVMVGFGGSAVLTVFAQLAQRQLIWARDLQARGEPSVSFDGNALVVALPTCSLTIERANLAGTRRLRDCLAIRVHDVSSIMGQLPSRSLRLRYVTSGLGLSNVACTIPPTLVSGKLHELERGIEAVVRSS